MLHSTQRQNIDGYMGDSHGWSAGRLLMSQALLVAMTVISKSNCTVIFINQLRVGVMFGNPETMTGRATKFIFRRLDVRRIEAANRVRDDRRTVQGSRLSKIIFTLRV